MLKEKLKLNRVQVEWETHWQMNFTWNANRIASNGAAAICGFIF